MIEIILTLLFVTGVAGVGAILARKMPVAQRMAANAGTLAVANFGEAAKNLCVAGIKKVPCFRDFSWLDFVQKILMKGRVVVLKAENKINDYMVKLRQKAEAEKNKEGLILDNYWHDLKTIVKTKNPMHHAGVKEVAPEVEETKAKTVYPVQATVESAVVDTESRPEVVDGPAISRVVMPADDAEKNQISGRKKKHSVKKKKFKDPFQW